jgi:hypothetical protein
MIATVAFIVHFVAKQRLSNYIRGTVEHVIFTWFWRYQMKLYAVVVTEIKVEAYCLRELLVLFLNPTSCIYRHLRFRLRTSLP